MTEICYKWRCYRRHGAVVGYSSIYICMILRKTSAKASAPAKIILFGEHFVVYDNPAILASINNV